MSYYFVASPAMTGMSGMSAMTGAFSWDDYANIEVRYGCTVLANMLTSAGAHFDGTNQLEIDGGAAQVTAYPISMVCWFRTTTNATQTLMWAGDKGVANENQSLRITGNNVIGRSHSVAQGSETATESGIDPDDGDWHMIAAVFTSDAVRDAYADGNTTNNTDSVTIGGTYDRTTIGRHADSTPSDEFIGDIDNAAIFDTTALTAAEVAWLYNSGAGRTWAAFVTAQGEANVPLQVNCKGWWALDEMSGVRMDYSGNSMHLVPGGNATGVTFASADSEWANVASAAASAPPCSICCSFKSTAASPGAAYGIGAISSAANNRLFLQITSGNNLKANAQTSGGTASATSVASCMDQAWHFGAAVFTESGGDVDSTTLYLDDAAGVVDGTNVTPDAAYTHTGISSLKGATADNPFNGTLDNYSMWTTALSAAQYTWLRTGGLTGGPATYQDVLQSNHADNPGTTGLVAWYKLNEADPSGGNTLVNVHDPGTHDLLTASGGAGPVSATGHVIDLPYAVAGTVSEVAEVEDRATEFVSSSDQKMTATTSPSVSYPFALLAWVYTDAHNDSRAVFSVNKSTDNNDNQVRLQVADDGQVSGHIKTAGTARNDLGSVISTGAWHCLLYVCRSATDRELYLDGVSDATGSDAIAVPSGLDRTGIGIREDSVPDLPMDGRIDEVMYFDSTLNDTDASEFYDSGAGVLAQDLIDETVALTSGKKPIHAWPCSKNHPGGRGEDIGTTGGITLTETNSPTDAAGVASGQTLGGLCWQLTDLSGNSNHDVQTTFAKRPEVVRTTTAYALRSDGTDDIMQTSAFSAISQPNTIFLLTTIRDQNAAQSLTDGIAAANEAGLRITAGDVFAVDAGTEAATTFGADYGNRHLWVVVINGASTKIYRDGGTGQTISVGAETQTGVSLFAAEDEAQPADQDIEMYLVNDGEMTEAEINTIGRYLIGTDWTAIA